MRGGLSAHSENEGTDLKWSVIIAAGPSLTRDDCDKLRGVGKTIAVNCGVLFAPWADILYGADGCWWRYYGPKLSWFKGERVSMTFSKGGVKRWRPSGWARTGGNGGHQSIQYAVEHGAKHLAIIGFDHQHTGGKAHFHGDHPRTDKVQLGNAMHPHHWVGAMNRTVIDLKRRDVEVVNLSRETALKCFPQMTVEEFLETL